MKIEFVSVKIIVSSRKFKSTVNNGFDNFLLTVYVVYY